MFVCAVGWVGVGFVVLQYSGSGVDAPARDVFTDQAELHGCLYVCCAWMGGGCLVCREVSKLAGPMRKSIEKIPGMTVLLQAQKCIVVWLWTTHMSKTHQPPLTHIRIHIRIGYTHMHPPCMHACRPWLDCTHRRHPMQTPCKSLHPSRHCWKKRGCCMLQIRCLMLMCSVSTPC